MRPRRVRLPSSYPRSAAQYDPSKGFKFCTYATYWIRQRISRSIADHSRVIRLPVHVHATLGNVAKTTRAMTAELGRKPSLEEVREGGLGGELETRGRTLIQGRSLAAPWCFLAPAKNQNKTNSPAPPPPPSLTPRPGQVSKRVNVPLQKLRMYTESSKSVVSLEGAVSNRHDDSRILGDKIAWDGLTPEEHTVASELRADLVRVMEELDARERQVVKMRFGLDDTPTHTHDEVAKKVGVSRERVRLIETKALNKLRHPSRNFRLREYFLGLLN